ncbi:MAG: hypothetical protein J6Y23_06745 [Prevotella sp.]|nr:hypothetical protein [Prevotella sp.]
MKTIVILIIMAAMTGLIACNASYKTSENDGKLCPIKKETTSILYSRSLGSGEAVLIQYNITSDSLTWKYTDHRNGFILSDVVRYDRKEFDALIDALSQVSFKVKKTKPDVGAGARGYSYYFYDINGSYLDYGVTNHVAVGDNAIAEKAISRFVTTHTTEGEKVTETARKEGVLYIDMEEFPDILTPFRVK